MERECLCNPHEIGRLFSGGSVKFIQERVAGLTRITCVAGSLIMVGVFTSLAQQPAATVAGVPVSGSFHARIQSWEIPFPDAKPAGIFFAKRNQSAWFSGEGANILGRFDSKTQQFESFHLRPDTRPYALVEHSGSGVQSTLYFVSRGGGYIGEFDPNTRDVREFRILGGRAQLEDLCFDHNGVIWFTMPAAQPPKFSQGAKVGRLNLFSSEIRLTEPLPHSDPHDLAVDPKGTIFFTERTARIGSIEPDSMKVTEHALPNPKIVASGIAITPDDALWITDSARGMLLRFDVASGQFREWPSPSGPHSEPMAIATANGVVWYAETGTTPNMLVRFDPAKDEFSSWPVDTGGVIGGLSAQPDGTLWFTLPSLNKIGQISPQEK